MKKIALLSIVICSLSIQSGTKNSKDRTKLADEVRACSEIFAGSIAAACIYGIVNDQVSARVCPEYFSKGFHRKNVIDKFPDGWLKNTLLTTNSPTKLGLLWGVIGTWWMGAGLSVPVMASARIGSWPKMSMKELIKPTGIALGVMGLCSLIEGLRGYRLAASGLINRSSFAAYVTAGVPNDSMNVFLADVYAHNAAYASGVCAALGLTCWIGYKRYQKSCKEKDILRNQKKISSDLTSSD